MILSKDLKATAAKSVAGIGIGFLIISLIISLLNFYQYVILGFVIFLAFIYLYIETLKEDNVKFKNKSKELQSQHSIDKAVIHDLKNCLIGIKMIIDANESANGGLRPVVLEIKTYADKYINYANENLLAGKLLLTKFSILDLLRKIQADKKILGQNFEIINQIDLKSINNFESNKELLRLILSELIDNALKSDPLSVAITTSLKEDWLQIDISNQGRINNTEQFLQEPTQAHDQHSGLGAYLAQILTKSLGGHIELKCNDNNLVNIAIKVPYTQL